MKNKILSVGPKTRTTLLRPKTKVHGMLWTFHKTDDDNWPSVPHGHSIDGKYKLELWSGNIYEISTRQLVFRARKKDMKNLIAYPGFLEFVKECRKEYKHRNPITPMPELSCKLYKYRGRKSSSKTVFQDAFYIRYDRV